METDVHKDIRRIACLQHIEAQLLVLHYGRGGRRGAMFYSLTLPCMLNGIDSFEYFTDVIDRVARMKPKSPVEQYRELLPDKWKKQD